MPDFPDRIETEPLFDARFELAPADNIGAGPLGHRLVVAVNGGTFEGPRLRGTFRAGGGDWVLRLPNGAAELDVRATMETHDGALLYLSYGGVLDVPPDLLVRALGGEDVAPSSYYFRTTPRIETGHEAYAWLNKTICIGYGKVFGGGVAYRVFAVK